MIKKKDSITPVNIPQNLQKFPPEQIIRMLQAQYQGPIPPSSEFSLYEKILPGSANRILAMSEDANKATIWIKKGELLLKFGGLILGFFITIVGIIGGIVLIYHGREISGIVALIVSFISLVSTVILGKKKKNT